MATFDIYGQEFHVLKWDADATSEGVNLYASVGGSRTEQPGAPGHRAEQFVGLLPARDGVAPALAILASYRTLDRTSVDHGDTVTLADPLWPGTTMRSFVLLRQRMEIIPALVLEDGSHVEFMQAIPLHPSELAFKTNFGIEALMEYWEARQVPFWDPDRVADSPQ